VWRMQQSKKGSDWTLLSYAVYVLPQKWLPVGIVQGRIAEDITKNLDAVRRHAEQLHADGAGAEAAGSGAEAAGSGAEAAAM
jgi:hypothetical protein